MNYLCNNLEYVLYYFLLTKVSYDVYKLSKLLSKRLLYTLFSKYYQNCQHIHGKYKHKKYTPINYLIELW